MATYDDGIPEDWYPGYYLDPRNAWKWMPAAFPGWLPSAMVRTPPAIWPGSAAAPHGTSAPGLLDGLAALARPKSIEEQLAELRRMSLIPDSLSGEARSQPQSAPSSWLAGAQQPSMPTTMWPDVPAPKSVAPRDDADLTPEMHRGLLDAYFRYKNPEQLPPAQAVSQFPPMPSVPAAPYMGSAAFWGAAPNVASIPPRPTAREDFVLPTPAIDDDPFARAALRMRNAVQSPARRGEGTTPAWLAPAAWMPGPEPLLWPDPPAPPVPKPPLRDEELGPAIQKLWMESLIGPPRSFAETHPPYPPGYFRSSATALQPTWRQRLAGALWGEERPSVARRDLIEGLVGSSPVGAPKMGLMDFVPGLGTTLGVQEAVQNDPWSVPFAALPAAGPVARRVAKIGKETAKEIGKEIGKEIENEAGKELVQTRSAISSKLFNPPAASSRPITHDYLPSAFPNGPPRDAVGNLTQTPEGVPLIAQTVMGRKRIGQPDVPLPVAKQEPTIEMITGQPVQYLPASQMPPGIMGQTTTTGGRPTLVELRNNFLPGEKEKARAHELGHVFDFAAGEIPTTGLEHELEHVYNTLNNPARTPGGLHADPAAGLYTPVDRGYSLADAPREYMAEALRAYPADPNWFKTVAPQTAKRIREYWNTHSVWARFLQFNSLAGIAAMNGLAPASSSAPDRSEPDL